MDNNQTNINLPNTSQQIPTESLSSLDYFINENKLLRNHIVFYQQELFNSKEANFALERQYQISNEEIELLRNQIRNYESIKQKSLETSASLKEDTIRLMEELSKQKDKMQNMEIAFQSNNKSISDYKNQIISLQQHLSEKNTIVSQHLLTIDKLTSAKSELEKEINQMRIEISNMKYKQIMNEQQLQNELKQTKENEQLAKINKDNIQQKELLLNDSYTRMQNEYNLLKQKNEALIQELNNQIRTLKEINEMKENQIYQTGLLSKEKEVKIEELIQSLNQMNKKQIQMKNESNFLKEMVNDKESEIKRLNEYKRKYETIEFYDKSSIKSSHFNISMNDIDYIKEDYQKLRLMHNQTKFERDNLLANNKLLNIQLKDYQELKAKSKEVEVKLDEYASIQKAFDKMQKEHNQYKLENKQYKERLDIIAQQNRRLLLQNELNYSKTKPNYLSQSLNEEKYEQFLYNNIEDFESKINNVIQANLKYQNEINEKNEQLIKYSKDFEVNNQLIKSMEEYVQGLELVNLSQKKENGQMKRSMTSSYFIWNDNNKLDDENENGNVSSKRKYSTNKESLELKIQELLIKNNELIEKEKMSQNELVSLRKQLENEAERNEKNVNDIIKLNNIIQHCNNQLSDKSKEITVIGNQNDNLNNQLKDKAAILIEKEKKINEMNQMISMLQNDKDRLNQTIDGILKDNDEKINETKMILERNTKSIIEENKQMKNVIDFIQTSVKDIVNPLLKEGIKKDEQSNPNFNVNVNDNDNDLQCNLNQKEKEFIELKEQIAQMKITIENISTENSMLKYKESIYQRKNAPYINRHIISEKQKHYNRPQSPILFQPQTESSLQTKPQPQSLFQPDTQSIFQPLSQFQSQSVFQPESQSNFQSQSVFQPDLSNDFNLLNNTSLIEEKYLKVVNENIELNDNITQMQNKLDELVKINKELISGNITGPYKALMNQIDELTNTVASLKMKNNSLAKEKESIISNYTYLNITNESLKEKQTHLEAINASLIKETNSLSENLKNYSIEIEQLKQKDAIIQAKEKEINALNSKADDLYITINKLENEKNEYNDNTKNLKEEIELKKKELYESNSKNLKKYYVQFKKSRSVITYFKKIYAKIEEQMNEVEKAKEFLNDKINTLELKNVAMGSELKEKDNLINDLKCEIKSLKELNSVITNEVKIIESEVKKHPESTPPTSTPNQDNQSNSPHLVLINSLFFKIRKARIMIIYLNNKVSQLEKEKESGTLNLINEYSQQKSALNEEIKANTKTLSDKDKLIHQLKSSLAILNIKNNVITQDIDILSGLMKKNYNEQQPTLIKSDNKPKKTSIEIEKNKAFTSLLLQMRNAIKMITYLINK